MTTEMQSPRAETVAPPVVGDMVGQRLVMGVMTGGRQIFAVRNTNGKYFVVLDVPTNLNVPLDWKAWPLTE